MANSQTSFPHRLHGLGSIWKLLFFGEKTAESKKPSYWGRKGRVTWGKSRLKALSCIICTSFAWFGVDLETFIFWWKNGRVQKPSYWRRKGGHKRGKSRLKALSCIICTVCIWFGVDWKTFIFWWKNGRVQIPEIFSKTPTSNPRPKTAQVEPDLVEQNFLLQECSAGDEKHYCRRPQLATTCPSKVTTKNIIFMCENGYVRQPVPRQPRSNLTS